MTTLRKHNAIKLFAVEDVVITVYGTVTELYSGGKSLVCQLKRREPAQLELAEFFSTNPILQVETIEGFEQDPRLRKLHGQQFRAHYFSRTTNTFTLRKVDKSNNASYTDAGP